MHDTIWSNSGDSHLVEPSDLWDTLPADMSERMPRSVRSEDGEWETIFVDGQTFRRKLPRWLRQQAELTDLGRISGEERAPGALDPALRLRDLDGEGIWAEVIYPSLGVWSFNIRDRTTVGAATRLLNDWAGDFQARSPRYVCCASLPLLDVDDSVAEVHRVASLGFKIAFFPTAPPIGVQAYNYPVWEPLWHALSETGMHIGLHIGTEPHDADRYTAAYFQGPGWAVQNYVETTYGGQRCVTQLISAGVLDRYPTLRLVSEGGATWGPFIADRMDEAYRQHHFAATPKLSRLPSEFLFEQVYASFQHDRSAVGAAEHLGWRNVMWGSDYPHLEGTFGHTQETLRSLFEGVPAEVRRRVTVGAFEELFPHVPKAPA